MALKKHADNVKKGVKGMAKDTFDLGRKKVYQAGSKIEEKIGEKGGLGGLLKSAAYGAAKSVVKGANDLRNKVKEEGGLGEVARKAAEGASNAIDRGMDRMNDALDGLGERIETRYKNFEETITTDGKYDPEKARAVLSDRAGAVKKFGCEAVESLSELIKSGASGVKEDYRRYVPSAEERKTRYAGIGDRYDGVLFRDGFEKCVSFYARAETKLPGKVKNRIEILNDIRSYAINGKGKLVGFYKEKKDGEKIAAVKKYL